MSPFTVNTAKFIINPHLAKSNDKETKKEKGKYDFLLWRVIVRVHTVSYDIGSAFSELLFSSDKPAGIEFWVAPLYFFTVIHFEDEGTVILKI